MSAWPETEERIDLEIAQLKRLVDIHRPLIAALAESEPGGIELSALAAFLHSLYNGLESIFKQIAADIDGGLPQSDRWHSHLLRSMAQATEKRAALIPQELTRCLVGFMGFRHVFRHAYTFELEWEKMRDLAASAEGVVDQVAVCCERFFGTGDE